MKIRRKLAVSGQPGWGERDARAAVGGALADAPQTPARRSRARGRSDGMRGETVGDPGGWGGGPAGPAQGTDHKTQQHCTNIRKEGDRYAYGL